MYNIYMCTHKTEIVLLTLGIIHMLIEWRLGKRAAIKGGPGSILSVLGLFFGIISSLIRHKYKNRGK